MNRAIKKAILIALIFSLVYFIVTNLFIFPCKIEGMSMFPTMAPNEIKLSNRWKVITKQSLNRGDIVLIEEPSETYISKEEFNSENLLAKYDKANYNPFRTRYVKRIIGISGDYIQITEENELYLNGEKIGYALKADYMFVDLIVPENSIYVLGDNRQDSTDSRSFGCVPIDKVYSVLF